MEETLQYVSARGASDLACCLNLGVGKGNGTLSLDFFVLFLFFFLFLREDFFNGASVFELTFCQKTSCNGC